MSVQPNQVTAYEFLANKGLTPAQASGVVGNLEQESGTSVNPEEPGGGIAQWLGARWSPSLQTGNPSQDLLAQLNHLWSELQGSESGALTALESTNTPSAAALSFSQNFERPGQPNNPQRESYATQFYNDYASLSPAQQNGLGDQGGAQPYSGGPLGQLGVGTVGGDSGGTGNSGGIAGSLSSLAAPLGSIVLRFALIAVGLILVIIAIYGITETDSQGAVFKGAQNVRNR